MRNTGRIISALLVIAGILAFAAVFAKTGGYPRFELKSLDGKQYSTSSTRGKAVFIAFFARKCKPCKEEVSFLNDLQKKFPDTLTIISFGFQETDKSKLEALVREWGIQYPACLDAEGKAAKAFGVQSLPRGFLLDHKGKLVEEFEGMSEKSKADLVKKLTALQPEIRKYCTSGPSFYIGDIEEATEGAKGLGKDWQKTVTGWLSAEGIKIAASPKDADYAISGNVSKIANIVGVEFIVKFTAANMEEFRLSDSVKAGDDSRLHNIFIERIHQIPCVPKKK